MKVLYYYTLIFIAPYTEGLIKHAHNLVGNIISTALP